MRRGVGSACRGYVLTACFVDVYVIRCLISFSFSFLFLVAVEERVIGSACVVYAGVHASCCEYKVSDPSPKKKGDKLLPGESPFPLLEAWILDHEP